MNDPVGTTPVRRWLLNWFPWLGACHLATHRLLAWGLTARMRASDIARRIHGNVIAEFHIRVISDQTRESPRPIVHLYAVCRNEEHIVRWFMHHYSRFVSEFHIFDNQSTDSTRSLLAQYRNVRVHDFDTNGTFDEGALTKIRNTAWKASVGRADFVVVCDMDEFLFHPRIEALLVYMKRNRFTVLKPHGYQMTSERLPTFDGARQLTELIRTGVDDVHNYSKTILFDHNRVDIHFGHGSHRSDPTGTVKILVSDMAKLLHYKYVSRELILRKTRRYREIFSEETLERGWNRHYRVSDEQAVQAFDALRSTSRKVL